MEVACNGDEDEESGSLCVTTSMPHPFFGAKDVCYIQKKVA